MMGSDFYVVFAFLTSCVYASVTCHGIGTVSKPHPQQESGSESDFELDRYEQATAFSDFIPLNCHYSPVFLFLLLFLLLLIAFNVSISLTSPPHLTIPEDQEWDTTPTSPSDDTSPQSPPPSIDRGPPV
jgi:hypothetical protein